MAANRAPSGWIMAALPALLILAGCGTQRASTFAELGPEANTKGFGDLYPPDATEGAFTFGVGDSVGILVQNNPDLSGTFVIRMDGKITMQVIGDVQVAGLTPDQVKKKLESKIAVYMKDVSLTVSALSIVSKKFYVAALNPITGGYMVRAVPYRGDTTLFEVWAGIGSPSSSIDDDTHIKVIRPDPRHPEVKVINIREMLVCGYSGANIQIKPNDIVYVPPTFWGRVNQFTSALALPFSGLFRLASTYASLDYMVQVIQGDADFFYGGGFMYGGGAQGGLGAGGFGAGGFGGPPPPGGVP
jgi:polysaccharide biosynthesis/export protein